MGLVAATAAPVEAAPGEYEAGFQLALQIEAPPTADQTRFPWTPAGYVDGLAVWPPKAAASLRVTEQGGDEFESNLRTRCDNAAFWPQCPVAEVVDRLPVALEDEELARLSENVERITGKPITVVRQVLDVELDGRKGLERLAVVAIRDPEGPRQRYDALIQTKRGPLLTRDVGRVMAVVDLDGDGSAELVTQTNYYEGVIYRMFYWRGGRLVRGANLELGT